MTGAHRSRPQLRTDWPIDLAAIGLLLVLGAVGLQPAFASWTATTVAVSAAAVGLGLATAGARWEWSVLTVSAATLGAYLLLAGPVVAPSTMIAVVIPSLTTLQALPAAVVQVWMDVLTSQPPLGDRPWMLAAPLLLGGITGVLAGSAALRARFAWLALGPALVMLLAPIALGTHQAVWPVVQGTVFLAVAVGWLARRAESAAANDSADPGLLVAESAADSRAMSRSRSMKAALMVAVAAVAGVLVTPTLLAPDAPRQTVRDAIEPPLDLRDYPSPLTAFRMYVKDRGDDVMFTVDNLPADSRMRLAVLDGYDGVVYTAAADGSAPFFRVGSILELEAEAEDPVEVQVRIEGYADVWLPTTGDLREVVVNETSHPRLAEELYHSRGGDVLMSPVGVAQGVEYVLTVRPERPISDSQLSGVPFATVVMPEVRGAPDAVAALTSELIGDASDPIEQIRALQTGLSANGYFSNGLEGEMLSNAGHTNARITTLLAEDLMIGDDEQYAVAMALMARSLGAPARVVVGFYPEDGSHGLVELTGGEVHAWVEVAFDGVGWVPFDPTPPPDQIVQEQTPEPQTSPRPQALDPPPPPDEPVELPDPPIAEEGEAQTEDEVEEETASSLWMVGLAGIPIVLVLLLIAAIVLAKALRARRRARAPRASDRASGGWSEVLDRARDLGVAAPPSATRREAAELLRTELQGTSALAVAERADAGVFDATEPTEEDLRALWADVDQLCQEMSRSVGWWSRLRARLSTKSLRHRTGGRRARRTRDDRTAARKSKERD